MSLSRQSPPLSKGGAAKRRGDSLSQRTFKVCLFFSVGAHTVRPRAAEVVGPYEKTGRFPKFCRGGTLGRPIPWAGMPVGRGLLDEPCPAPPPCLHGRRRSCILRPPVRRGCPRFFPAAHPLSAAFMQKRQRHNFFPPPVEVPHPQGLSTLSTEFSTMCYVKCNQAAFCIICRFRPVKRFSCGKSTKI